MKKMSSEKKMMKKYGKNEEKVEAKTCKTAAIKNAVNHKGKK